MKIELFGKLNDGREVSTVELENKSGMTLKLSNFGAAIVSIKVLNKSGELTDVVLGYDKLEDYVSDGASMGVVVGRYGNRIKDGRFSLDGKEYQLEKNDGNNHLHGGSNGFSKRVWDIETDCKSNTATMKLYSPDGDCGYPGDLQAIVNYTLTDDNEVIIDYKTTTTTKTICNLTNHSYFNLDGGDSENILDHILQINSQYITQTDNESIPTGELYSIKNTAFDFLKEKAVAKDIFDALLERTSGYDHNYVLDNNGNLSKCATVYSPKSGIKMQVSTNSLGMQFYTGNFLKNIVGKNKKVYSKHSGLCLETQLFPDSINHKNFPSCIVTKENPQAFKTIFKFMLK